MPPKEIEAGNLIIKPANYEVYLRGEKLDLTLKEFQLLKCWCVIGEEF